mmetsp:Transcript_60869/g.143801  ORF Transcript_60869/g.143801 Transcript_60869/m.143801 type:complete len:207 (-) Transcript_60869:550-1170(-)
MHPVSVILPIKYRPDELVDLDLFLFLGKKQLKNSLDLVVGARAFGRGGGQFLGSPFAILLLLARAALRFVAAGGGRSGGRGGLQRGSLQLTSRAVAVDTEQSEETVAIGLGDGRVDPGHGQRLSPQHAARRTERDDVAGRRRVDEKLSVGLTAVFKQRGDSVESEEVAETKTIRQRVGCVYAERRPGADGAELIEPDSVREGTVVA